MKIYIKSIIYIYILTTISSCNKSKSEAEAFLLKGDIQFKKGEYVLAERYYAESIKKYSKNEIAYNNIGLIKLNLQNYTDAFYNFNAAIKINQEFSAAYFNRAKVEIELGKFIEAKNDLVKVKKKYTDSSKYFFLLGLISTQSNAYDNAVAEFSHAINLQPNYTESYINRGTLLYSLKKYENAKSDFKKAIQLDSTQSVAFNNMGLVLIEEGNYNDALIMINKALKLKTSDSYFYNNKALCEIMLGKYIDAKININISLNKDNKNPWVYRNLGLLNLKLNQKQEAIDNLKKSFELSNSSPIPHLHFYLGQAYLLSKEIEKACKEFSISAQLQEEDGNQFFINNCK